MYWLTFVVFPVFVLGHFLLCLRVHRLLTRASNTYRARRWPKALLAAAAVLFTAMPLLGCVLRDGALRFRMMKWGNLWFGFFVYFGLATVLLHLIEWILRRRLRGSARWARACLIAALAASLATNAYGLYHATDIQVTRVEIPLEKRADIDRLRVCLIADLHMSVNSRPSTIEKMAAMVNAEQPDVVLFAGDLLTSTLAGLEDKDAYVQALNSIKAPYGVYGIYGNHDVDESLLGGFAITPEALAFRSDDIRAYANRCFPMYSDEVVSIADGAVTLVCREDGEKPGRGDEPRMAASELMADIDADKPVFVLEHEPVEYAELSACGADLVLSGHTHNGQLFPGTLLIGLFNENAYGVKRVGNAVSVVTSGVGFYGPPLRVGSDSEIMILDITFGN